MQAAQTAMNVAASNIANANSAGYSRQQVLQSANGSGGVQTTVVSAPAGVQGIDAALTTDLVAQLQAKNSFMANLAVFKSGNSMAGALLDLKA